MYWRKSRHLLARLAPQPTASRPRAFALRHEREHSRAGFVSGQPRWHELASRTGFEGASARTACSFSQRSATFGGRVGRGVVA